MIYLDYSATTPVHKDVLEAFSKVSCDFIGNPNSLHKLGVETKKLIDSATVQIANILKVKAEEIIYTSGASEANNTAIKGIALRYQNRGKHIITTKFEHSSIYGPLSYLQSLGFEVDFVDTDEFGIVKLDHLKNLLKKDTILVSISAVNSEIGIIQPIDKISKLIKENSHCFFHSDLTQIIGKKPIDLTYVDLASFSAHKFYGVKGIGCLVKKANIELIPLIQGGKSTTIYRSGTPAAALIVSMAKALRLTHENIDQYEYVASLNKVIVDNLKEYNYVKINSNSHCLPHILNLSVLEVKPESLLHALEEKEIYISTQTACASDNSYSKAVLALTNDMVRAKSSVRISLSYKTTEEEIKIFNQEFIECIKKLKEVSNESN